MVGDNKILILCATVDGTEFLQELCEEIFPGETSRYYGGLKQKEKDEALTKRIICATSQSLGTGADIKGIQHVYMVATYSNWIDANQLPGRARKIDGVDSYYCEFINSGYYKTWRQYEKRKPELIKKSKTGNIIMIE